MRARHRHLNPRAAGATLVLDSRYITGLSDGDPISTWDDKSGNGYSPTASSTARPIYKTSIQGGNAIARFDGSNDALYYNANLSTVDALSLLCVAKWDATNTRRPLFDAKNAAGNFKHFTIETNTFTSTGDNYDFYSSNNALEGNVAVTTNFRVISIAADTTNGNSIINNTTYKVDGSTNTLTLRTGNGNYQQLTNVNGFVVGSFNDNGPTYGLFFDGDIGTIAAFPAQITGALMKRLEHAAAYCFKISCN